MKTKLIIVLVLALTTTIGAYAQNTLKVGYTNLDYILGLMPEAKQIESDLQTYEKQLKSQLESKVADYEKKLQEYQKGVSSGLMADAVKQDKEKELIGLQGSIKEFEETAQSSLQKKQVSLLEPVLAKVQKSIDKVAAANGYTYILSTHADYGGSAIILYARNKDEDISNLVLKDLGVTPPAPKATTTTTTTIPATTTTPKK